MGGFRKISKFQTAEKICKYCGRRIDLGRERFGTNQKEYWHTECREKAEGEGKKEAEK